MHGPSTQTLATYGSNFLIQGPNALPNFSPSGAFSATTTNAGPFTGSDNYELRDMVSLTKGKHTLSLGGEFALDKTMFWADLLNFGTISFATSAPTSTGNVFSDWVTGQASSFEQDTPYITLLSYWHTAVFLQDNYRITPRFTANLGIRWDIDTPPVESLTGRHRSVPGEQSTVTPAAPKGMLFPGDPGVGRGIITTKFHHVSPRVGFAWDPYGDGKTAFRAAAGVFYGTTSGNEWNQPGNGAPFAIRQSFGPLNSITNIYSTPGDFPSTAPGGGIFPYIYSPSAPKFFPTAAVESIDKNAQYPYIYQFNLSVQRQLPAQISLTVAYVGTLSHNVPTMIDGNYAPYSTAFGTAQHFSHQRRRPAPIRSLCWALSNRSGRHQHRHHGTEHLSDHKPARQLQRPSSLGEEAAVAWLHYQRFLCLEPRAAKLERVGDWTDDRAGFRLLWQSLHRHQ